MNDAVHSAAAPSLARDESGQLQLVAADGAREAVTAVRAFPLSAPDEGVSLVGADGRERLWIEHVPALPEDARRLLQEALAGRDFAPVIARLVSVSSFAVPSTWQVETDRGATSFVLKGEEDIRRLENGALLITSAHGVQFRVPDPQALDRPSNKLLERFL